MTEIIKNKFEEIWSRIKQETPIKTMSELAELTGITQSGLSKAKGRNEFSASWAYAVGNEYGLLTEWIMTGEGPKRLEDIKGDFTFYEELEAWARETGRSEDIQWLRNQIESFYPMFTEWKKRREKGAEAGDEFPSSKVA
ncbi:MAG: helix-turn-helix domain-containing protein [Desulfobulbus sp.]|nr:helix-turn-helix domain-containing protein [Desulfobulbus sp.]